MFFDGVVNSLNEHIAKTTLTKQVRHCWRVTERINCPTAHWSYTCNVQDTHNNCCGIHPGKTVYWSTSLQKQTNRVPRATTEPWTQITKDLKTIFMVTLCNSADHYIFALWFLSSFFLSSPNLSCRRLDVCHISTHGLALVRIQDASLKPAARGSLKTQDAKKVHKNRHLGTIAPRCRAISLQLRHVSTIGKKLVKQQYVLHMSPQYGELRPTSAWDRSSRLRHSCKFQRVSHLGGITARHLVVGVSQTLRRWTEGATYVRQGDHYVGYWPTFLVLLSLVLNSLERHECFFW